MDANEPLKPVEHVEKEIRAYRPIRSLFLLDVLRDRDSRPVLLWAGIALLTGVLVYHWLEGWSLLDALYFCVITLATVGYVRRPDAHDPMRQGVHHCVRDQRHRDPAGVLRPDSDRADAPHREAGRARQAELTRGIG